MDNILIMLNFKSLVDYASEGNLPAETYTLLIQVEFIMRMKIHQQGKS